MPAGLCNCCRQVIPGISATLPENITAMEKLAIGVDDFKRLREHNAYFVDKSLFIEEVIEDISDVLFFPRPRRFGKTLNMSMLHYFFNNKNTEENHRIFDGLAITKSPVFEQHQGQYPVVSLSFKSCKGDDFDTVYSEPIRVIADTFKTMKKYLKKTISNRPKWNDTSI